MRITAYQLFQCGLLFTMACGEQDDDSRGLSRDDLASSSDTDGGAWPGEFSDDRPGEPPPPQLECEKGGSTSGVRVAFRCDEITVETCKDLSNVVIEYEDGVRQRFEGQQGHVNVFAGEGDHVGASIARVWVKAGANHSGEGPGYGQRFDAPTASCVPSDGGGEVEPPVTSI